MWESKPKVVSLHNVPTKTTHVAACIRLDYAPNVVLIVAMFLTIWPLHQFSGSFNFNPWYTRHFSNGAHFSTILAIFENSTIFLTIVAIL